MHMKIKQNVLKQAVDIHSILVDEIKIKFLKDRLQITSVDPPHIQLVKTKIPKIACEEYTLYRTGEIEIGIDLDKLKDFLKLFKKHDVFTIDYDNETHKLIFKQGNLTRTMGLLDTAGMPDPKIPKLELKNKVTINTKTFHDNLKKVIINKYRSENKIKMTKNTVILEDCDQDGYEDKVEPVIIDNNLTVDYFNNNHTLFSGDTLIDQIKQYNKYYDTIIIETTAKTPIKVSGDNDTMQFEYYLAPILKEEEQEKTDIKEEQKEETEPEPVDVCEPTEPTEPLIMISKKPDKDKQEIDIYKDRKSICKPKQCPYEKQQWTVDMDAVKEKIEQKLSKIPIDKLRKITDYQGFVFFVYNLGEKTIITVNNEKIEQSLPEGYVLIAWSKLPSKGWVAQTVKKAV